jgi:hypothetical protein
LRDYDEILFSTEGGVDVGDVESRATTFKVSVGQTVVDDEIKAALLEKVEDEKKE